MTEFNSQVSVYRIIYSYMQPYELAMVTDVHTTDTYYNAAENGNLEYLQRPQDIYTYNKALYYAAKHNQLDAIRLLAKLGVTSFGSALSIAAKYNRLAVIELLIELGKIDSDNVWFDAALSEAAEYDSIDALRLLAKYSQNYNFTMYHAVRLGKLASVKVLVELGATGLNTALGLAALKDQFEVVKWLLEFHPFTNNKIDLAINVTKNPEICELLKKYKLDG